MTEHRDIAGHEGFMIGDDGVVWTCWGNRGVGVNRRHWIRLDHWEEVQQSSYKRSGPKYKDALGRPNYQVVRIERKRYYVHVLVLEAFIGPCPRGQECRHLNDDKSDNSLSNLKWGTKEENMHDRALNGMQVVPDNRGENSSRATLTDDDVREIRRLALTVKSKQVIANHMRVSRGTVSAILLGHTWRHVQ